MAFVVVVVVVAAGRVGVFFYRSNLVVVLLSSILPILIAAFKSNYLLYMPRDLLYTVLYSRTEEQRPASRAESANIF